MCFGPPIRIVAASDSLPVEGSSIKLSHSHIIPWRKITVTIDGAVEWPDGTKIRLTRSVLPVAESVYFTDFSQGLDYDLEWLTGILTFPTYLTVEHVDVDYFYEDQKQCNLQS